MHPYMPGALIGTGVDRIFNLHNGKGIFADNPDSKDNMKHITKVCGVGFINNRHGDNVSSGNRWHENYGGKGTE